MSSRVAKPGGAGRFKPVRPQPKKKDGSASSTPASTRTPTPAPSSLPGAAPSFDAFSSQQQQSELPTSSVSQRQGEDEVASRPSLSQPDSSAPSLTFSGSTEAPMQESITAQETHNATSSTQDVVPPKGSAFGPSNPLDHDNLDTSATTIPQPPKGNSFSLGSLATLESTDEAPPPKAASAPKPGTVAIHPASSVVPVAPRDPTADDTVTPIPATVPLSDTQDAPSAATSTGKRKAPAPVRKAAAKKRKETTKDTAAAPLDPNDEQSGDPPTTGGSNTVSMAPDAPAGPAEGLNDDGDDAELFRAIRERLADAPSSPSSRPATTASNPTVTSLPPLPVGSPRYESDSMTVPPLPPQCDGEEQSGADLEDEAAAGSDADPPAQAGTKVRRGKKGKDKGEGTTTTKKKKAAPAKTRKGKGKQKDTQTESGKENDGDGVEDEGEGESRQPAPTKNARGRPRKDPNAPKRPYKRKSTKSAASAGIDPALDDSGTNGDVAIGGEEGDEDVAEDAEDGTIPDDPEAPLDPTAVTMSSLVKDTGRGRPSTFMVNKINAQMDRKARMKRVRQRMRRTTQLEKEGHDEDEIQIILQEEGLLDEAGTDSTSTIKPAEPRGEAAVHDEPTSNPNGDDEDLEGDEGEEVAAGEDDEEGLYETQYAPQMRLVDGVLVVDEESTQITRPQTIQDYEIVEEQPGDRRINSATYGKRERHARWTNSDTDMFYDALRQFGTDFEMISKMFVGRSRRNIKAKWVREEKTNPERVTEALMNKKKVDTTFYSKMADVEFDGKIPADPMSKYYEGLPTIDVGVKLESNRPLSEEPEETFFNRRKKEQTGEGEDDDDKHHEDVENQPLFQPGSDDDEAGEAADDGEMHVEYEGEGPSRDGGEEEGEEEEEEDEEETGVPERESSPFDFSAMGGVSLKTTR